MAPFRWPLPLNDAMLATEVAARKPMCATDWDVIASILSTVFSTNERKVCVDWPSLQREARPYSEQIFGRRQKGFESFVLKENERRVAKVENSRNIKRQTSNLGPRFAVHRIIRKTRC